MSPEAADNKIRELVAERVEEKRKIAIGDALIGATIVCLFGAFLYYEVKHPSALFRSQQGKAMFFAVVIGFYGLWKLVKGAISLVWPRSEGSC